jgi:uncharacterized surface protein with fasciclin (FAS1) repeats
MRTLALRLFAAVSTSALVFASLAPAPALAGSYGQAKGAKAAKAAKKDIVQTAQSAKTFTTLLAALKAADLTKTLRGDGPFTVFAPTDEAFAKLPPGTLDGLLKDPEKLKGILLYHVASGKVLSGDVAQRTEATTIGGQNVKIDASNGVVLNQSAKVVQADILASNGVIHVIDTVLLPGQ